jgi:hypothetical protein
LRIIDACHTSRWCGCWGAVGYGHSTKNYSLFICRVCGQIVNSDRKSSLAVCVRAFLGRIGPCPNQLCFGFQVSRKYVLQRAFSPRCSRGQISECACCWRRESPWLQSWVAYLTELLPLSYSCVSHSSPLWTYKTNNAFFTVFCQVTGFYFSKDVLKLSCRSKRWGAYWVLIVT